MLNTVIGALLIEYGIWLRGFFKHQVHAKDATIDALESALTTKDAEIFPPAGGQGDAEARREVAKNVARHGR